MKCQFCGSMSGPFEAQDMGEGRTMDLCPSCRLNIAEGVIKALRAELAAREEMDKIVRDWLIDNPPIPGAEISDAVALDAYHAMRRLATRLAAADGASGVR